MRWIIVLIFGYILSCRYRYNFGIYVPLQVGAVYSYTSRYDDTGEYESPLGKYYRPDTLFILKDTVYNGISARKVYVRKQNSDTLISRDTAIYYILKDTLFAIGKASNLMVPYFYFNYGGGLYVGEPEYSDTFITMKLLYVLADVGDMWEVGKFSGTLKIYRNGFGNIPDSIRYYSVNGKVYAEFKGYEDLNLPYGKVEKCALIVYNLSITLGSIPVEFEAFKTWWCSGLGQVSYVMSATQYRRERKLRMELANLEFVNN